MATRRRRKLPMEDATIHGTKAQDKTVELDSLTPIKTQEQSDADIESSDSAVFSAVLETSERPSTSTMQTQEQTSDADIESSDSAVFSAVLETSERPSTSTMQTQEQTSDADIESSDSAVFSAVLETSERPSTSTMQTQEQTSDAHIESSDSAVFSAVLETSERPSTSTMQTQEQTSDAHIESSDSAVFSAVLETSERPSTSTMQSMGSQRRKQKTILNTSQEADTDVNTSQDTVTSTQGSADKRKHTIRLKGSKGRQPSKKKKWDEHEIDAVERHMMSFITSCRVPGKSECEKCINMEKTVLKNKNWLAIKFYVKNHITSLKKKV